MNHTAFSPPMPERGRRGLRIVRWWLAGLALLVAVARGTVPCLAGGPPGPPVNLVARAGDNSVALHWFPPADATARGYQVYRAAGTNAPFTPVNPPAAPVLLTGFADVNATNGIPWLYHVTAVGAAGEGAPSETVAATPKPFASDADFLDLLEATAFDYFWHEANPTNGLVKDRSTTNSFCSIAAVGFGLTGIGTAIDHGWITREAGRARTLATLQTFWQRPQGDGNSGTIGSHGWFYHFLDLNRATRYGTVELSSIDTALLVAGVLYARGYFDGPDADEQTIRDLADNIFNRVDWQWMMNGGATFSMGWTPESKFLSSRWIGYNEGMILYLLALGATNNPPPATAWTAWTAGYQWRTNYGYSYIQFPPLFGHQYSHCWVDFRYVTDSYLHARGITYFENSRRATLAQQAYCIANPGHRRGYGTNVWGLTACDGPSFNGGYAARGAPPPQHDDGTLAPTAAGGSMPFTPDISIAMLRQLYDNYRTNAWTSYGFRDAFNLTWNWWDPDVLGLDQGPILLMVENYRTQRVWRTMMKSPILQRGLQRAGFQPLSFASPAVQLTNAPAVTLQWNAPTNATFQVEYSPDLDVWFVSPTGFLLSSNAPAVLSWTDNGPPATEAPPDATPERFYRVLHLNGP